MSKSPHQKKMKILFDEYDANQVKLSELRRLNQHNPIPSRMYDHGLYLVWSQSLRLQIFQEHFRHINQAQERASQRASQGA